MKLIPLKAILMFLLFFCFKGNANAQNRTELSRADSASIKSAKSLYFELFGNGLLYSVNYDTRFTKRRDGIGGRIGAGYFASEGDNAFTLPIVINYLAGKRGKYFEFGGGLSYYNVNSTSSFILIENGNTIYNSNKKENYKGVYGTLIFGYRSQPEDGGFCFRAGVAPIILEGTFAPYWPYVSFGYTF